MITNFYPFMTKTWKGLAMVQSKATSCRVARRRHEGQRAGGGALAMLRCNLIRTQSDRDWLKEHCLFVDEKADKERRKWKMLMEKFVKWAEQDPEKLNVCQKHTVKGKTGWTGATALWVWSGLNPLLPWWLCQFRERYVQFWTHLRFFVG